MSIIHSYITRLFFKYFGMVLGMVIVVYLSIDFFGMIDNLMAASLSASGIIAYFLYKIPMIVSQITPAALLLSVLIVFGLMSKNNEIIALKSGGISEYYLVTPIVVIGLCLSIALFFFTETIAPITTAKANRLAEKKKEDKQVITSTEKNIWIRGDRSITHISFYNPVDKTIFGITIVYFDDKFDVTRRVDAKQAIFQDDKWVLLKAMTQKFDRQSDNSEMTFAESVTVDLDLKPDDLKRVEHESEEMSFASLMKYIQKVEKEGYDATKYRVDLYAKTAFPFVCLIMSLLSSGIALRGKTREGMSVSFAYAIITAFCYWGLYSFCLSLGYGDMIPPLIAAWMANAIFFCGSGLVVLNLE
jgi:lipopolysaccharide export system permease protein